MENIGNLVIAVLILLFYLVPEIIKRLPKSEEAPKEVKPPKIKSPKIKKAPEPIYDAVSFDNGFFASGEKSGDAVKSAREETARDAPPIILNEFTDDIVLSQKDVIKGLIYAEIIKPPRMLGARPKNILR